VWQPSCGFILAVVFVMSHLISHVLSFFLVGMRTTLDTLILTYFVSCGIARLARFNATVALLPKDSSGKISHFEGLPIPSSLGLVAILAYLVIGKGQFHADEFPYGVIDLAELVGIDSKLGQVHAFTLLFAVQGTAMVSKTLRIPKP
jgi:CDP-diacylglycerol--serine O-phosphatidyltransferase